MKPQLVARGVYRVGLRGVNVFLIEAGDELVLVDAGLKWSPPRITEAIYSLGRLPHDVKAIVVTHAHGDHVGGLAEMKRRTGAEVWMHPADAELVARGVYGRPFGPSPGRIGEALRRTMNARPEPKGPPVTTDHETADGDELPFDGLRALHTPGHTAGHLALLLPREGGVLFVGDAAANRVNTGVSPVNEDLEGSRRSLERLATLDFEVACFSHGRPLRHDADQAFRDLVAGFPTATVERSGAGG